MQLPAVQTKFLDLPNSFSLRNGATLDKVRVAYEQYGTLTPNKDNAIHGKAQDPRLRRAALYQ